ncbi:MAG: C45 family peptidase [Casimicrobiaceae bacterium]
MSAPTGQILDLRGSAYDRGRLQAQLHPDRIADVTVAVTRRLRELGPALALPKVIDWLDAQHAFTRDNDPDGYVEVQGIAEGFGIAADALFACYYGNVIADLSEQPALADACTAWAAPRGEHGPVVVKNRDFRGKHIDLQCVFRHTDPEWGGRRILCVGNLGAPGAYAGGINTDGLAVADTQVGTVDHGEGWLRSFLMTRILRECATVSEAVGLIFRTPHAGGGTLLLGDATGAVAAIELAHRAVAADEPGDSGYVARTNHFVSERLAGRDLAPSDDIGARTSRARIATLDHALRALPLPFTLDAIKALMARHGDSANAALCRHEEGRDTRTIGSAIFDCKTSALHVALESPCQGHWERIVP